MELNSYYYGFLTEDELEDFQYLPDHRKQRFVERTIDRFGPVPESYGNFNINQEDIDISEIESLPGSIMEERELRFNRLTREIADNVRMDWITTEGFEELSEQDYINLIYKESNREGFRNIIFSLVDLSENNQIFRHTSIAEVTIQNYMLNNNLTNRQKAINEMVDLVLKSEYEKVWGDYDDENSLNSYIPSRYCLGVVYEYPTVMGGGEISTYSCKYLNYISAPRKFDIGNCIFDCLYQLCDKKFKLDLEHINYKWKINKSTLIAQKHIPYIEKYLKIDIDIYLDELDENNDIIYYYKSKNIFNNKCKLVLNNKHYFIFNSIKEEYDIENVIINKDHPIEYLFYDFETYMNKDTYEATPYMLSYHHIDNYGKVIESKVLLKDEEDDDFNLEIYKVFEKFSEGKRNIFIIGYNNGAFDDYLLIKILTKYTKKLWNTIIDMNNKVLQFKWGCLISKDLFRFLNTSLRSALEAFKCNVTKGEINHKEIQLAYENGKFKEYINKNKNQLINYSNKDVIGLCELYFKVRNQFLSINSIMDINNFMTLSQMTMKGFMMSFEEKYGKNFELIKLSREMDLYVRQSLVGGKTRVYDNKYCEDVIAIDCTSLYPYSMINNEFAYIKKKWDVKSNKWIHDTDILDKVNTYKLGDKGFYKIKILSQPEENIYPKIKDDKTWDWDYKDTFETYTDHIKLEYFIKCGGKYDFIEGYKFNKKVLWNDFFKDYMENIKNMKIKQDEYKKNDDSRYNPVLRECLKLLLNSLSGKMVQRPIIEEKKLVNSKKQLNKLEKEHKPSFCVVGDPIHSNLWLCEWEIPEDKIRITSSTCNGIFIYSYSQVYMHKSCLGKIENKYKHTTDTDSLYFCRSQIEKIEGVINDDFGGFKYDIPINIKQKGYFAAKKIYVTFNNENKVTKYRFKGVKKNDYFIKDLNEYNLLDNLINKKRFIEVNEISKNMNDFNRNVEAIKNLCEGKKINILCYQMRKDITTSSVKGVFIIKDFDIK